MTCESVVRIATAADHLEAWRLLLQDYNEGEMGKMFKLAPEKIDWLLRRLLQPELISETDTGTRGIIGVIGPVGALEAIAAIIVATPWFSHDMVLNDPVVYVDPNYRKSHHFRTLIEWTKGQSAVTGIPLISGVLSRERTEGKVRLYQRVMPEKIGAYFLYDPKASVVTSSGNGVTGYQ